LLAEPFDRAAAGQALSRARLAASELQARGHAALLDTLEEMPPEARAAVAERLGRAMRRVEARDRQSASQAAGSPASVTWSRPSDFAP
ncbi:MAG: periplasmic heavy metal sensor, partial [Roseicyclus sp.]